MERRVLNANILKAKYEAKLKFLAGDGGSKQKNLWRKYGYFLELLNGTRVNII